jgi:hypothetical protein
LRFKVFLASVDVLADQRHTASVAALMEYVREGDTVVVWKLDRLGRNTLHILETVKALTDRCVTLAALSCVLSVAKNELPQPAVVRP